MKLCEPAPQPALVGRTIPTAARPLLALLRQLEGVLETLSDEQYKAKPVGVVESSIGGHVRHNLDHIEALLRALRTDGELNYDHRERGTAVEHDRGAARDRVQELIRVLSEWPWERLPGRLRVTARLDVDLPPVAMETSAVRELGFVISHTIHHNALIRVMLKLLEVEVPATFGYAPSTVVYERGGSCAQ